MNCTWANCPWANSPASWLGAPWNPPYTNQICYRGFLGDLKVPYVEKTEPFVRLVKRSMVLSEDSNPWSSSDESDGFLHLFTILVDGWWHNASLSVGLCIEYYDCNQYWIVTNPINQTLSCIYLTFFLLQIVLEVWKYL